MRFNTTNTNHFKNWYSYDCNHSMILEDQLTLVYRVLVTYSVLKFND